MVPRSLVSDLNAPASGLGRLRLRFVPVEELGIRHDGPAAGR